MFKFYKNVFQGLLSSHEGSTHFQLNLSCPILLPSSVLDPTVPPPTSFASTTVASTNQGITTGLLCLRLARLPPDRTDAGGEGNMGQSLLELCKCDVYVLW